jgi:hypothetical protein
MSENSAFDLYINGAFTLLGAVIGGLLTRDWQTTRKLRIREYVDQDLTGELRRSGLGIKITKSGKPVENIIQSRLNIKNIGKQGLTNIEITISGVEKIELLGVTPSSESVICINSVVLNPVSESCYNCVVGHLSPKDNLDLFVYTKGSGAKFECKQTDFLIVKDKDLDPKEYYEHWQGLVLLKFLVLLPVTTLLLVLYALVKYLFF